MDTATLTRKAHWARTKALDMGASAGKAHLGGSFSGTEILVALYYGGSLRLSPDDAKREDRDHFILSKGHACQVLYAVLADCGFYGTKELETYGKNGSKLGGHPDHFLPGVEISSGSLGHGIGIGCGRALSDQLDHKDSLTIVLLGDGECCEGSVWEAALFAASQELRNLIVIVDNNKVGAIDRTEIYCGDQPIENKWKAFGWDTETIDGHRFEKLCPLLESLRTRKSTKPLAIIAETVKGKGISFMENTPQWHHGVPKDELLTQAYQDLHSSLL